MPASPPPSSQTLGAGESFNYCHYDLEISAVRRGLQSAGLYLHRAQGSGREERGEEGMKTNIPSPKPQITSLCVTATVDCDAKGKTGNFEIHISCQTFE